MTANLESSYLNIQLEYVYQIGPKYVHKVQMRKHSLISQTIKSPHLHKYVLSYHCVTIRFCVPKLSDSVHQKSNCNLVFSSRQQKKTKKQNTTKFTSWFQWFQQTAQCSGGYEMKAIKSTLATRMPHWVNDRKQCGSNIFTPVVIYMLLTGNSYDKPTVKCVQKLPCK